MAGKFVVSVMVSIVLGGCSSLQSQSGDDSRGTTTEEEVVYKSSALDEFFTDLALTVFVESALEAVFGKGSGVDNSRNRVSPPQHTTTTEKPAGI